ncbi:MULTISPECIES: hypothetical protein [unclassified Roseateles]|uniref:hypothetical protein n=1 Tax=unclassified Roseateles TaxID=2626991 RepID=UPI0006FC4C77|nr:MULTISPECIES: hypothetical protein [unclassified Roseateles]KQW45360.1 hypothetical protein ASC81_10560 [Pelomonas sp. Root405]KRA72204.1 hypothetical protein ASD88_10560 [Pelomonas sp. Root662]
MNHDDPTHRSPPRAEPLQPDRPTRGDDKQKERSPEASRRHAKEQAEQLKEQTETALENTREGYGGS